MSVGAEEEPRWVIWGGSLILTVCVLYFLFTALNEYWMPEQKGTAIVVQKKIQQKSRVDVPQNISGKTVWVQNITPDTYFLRLRIEESEDEFKVSKDVFDSVSPKDRIPVTYTGLRLTNGISVVGIQD
jgi:hypothetical protein